MDEAKAAAKRAAKRNYMRLYRRTTNGQAAAWRYDRSLKGKKRHSRYDRSPKGRARRGRYRTSAKGRAAVRRLNALGPYLAMKRVWQRLRRAGLPTSRGDIKKWLEKGWLTFAELVRYTR